MTRSGKWLAFLLGFLVLAVILVLRWPRKHAQRFAVQMAHDTCACDSDYSRIVLLRISNTAEITIGSEQVKASQLARRLREIFGTHADGVLYVFPEEDAPLQRVENVIDIIQHVRFEKSESSGVPERLQAQPDNMNIQIRLVTPAAINRPCPQNCFNWAVEGIPILPRQATSR